MIGRIDAHPIDHLAAKLRDDVKEIVHERCLRTMCPRFEFVCLAHVHHRHLEPGAARRPGQRKEGAHIFPLASATDPEDFARLRLGHDRGIAMPFLDREFINHDAAHASQIDGP